MKSPKKTCGNCRYMKISTWTCDWYRHYPKVRGIAPACEHWNDIQPACANCHYFKSTGPRFVIGDCVYAVKRGGESKLVAGAQWCSRWELQKSRSKDLIFT